MQPIIIYLFFFGYILSIRHAKSRRPIRRKTAADTEVPAAANTNHYTLSGRKPRQKPPSTIHTRRGLSFLSARHRDSREPSFRTTSTGTKSPG